MPGFRSARRFRLRGVVNPDLGARFTHVVVYELDGDPDAALDELAKANLGNAEVYAAAKESDEGFLPLPAWFGEVLFASWNCYALGEAVEAETA